MKNSFLYQEIFEPEVIAEAPRFADRTMMITREGEIRAYGTKVFEHEDGTRKVIFTVMRSNDNGMSFQTEEADAGSAGGSVASPWSDQYVTLLTLEKEHQFGNVCGENEISAAVQFNWKGENGVYVFRSTSPDGPWTCKKISDNLTHLQRLPLPLKKWKRWINVGQRRLEDNRLHPIVLLSDDDGENWRESVLPVPPVFEPAYPHKGVRWQDPGVEPAFAETPSGKIIMLLRTSKDVHYECFSEDGGETWSEMKPSIFYAVATMPGIYSLSDGRMLAIWNNTCPLPELDHREQFKLTPDEISGVWEDVFTNRDAIHGAISEDEGKTWRGFRELTLNPIRGNSDFRSIDGGWYLRDKSVHQNQIIELPDNKVLLHCGQHVKCSRIILFDLDYLYASGRSEDFRHGLQNVSTHLYCKSYSGGCRGAGHCSWNRRPGAQLMPLYDENWSEALLISRRPDERLVSEREGVAWNFPGCRKGKVCADFTLNPGTDGVRISLADRWINPCDEYVKDHASFSFVLDGRGCVNGVPLAEPGKCFTLTLDFDLDQGIVRVSSETGKVEIPYSRTLPVPFGSEVNLSYFHVQTASEKEDRAGVFLHGMQMKMA